MSLPKPVWNRADESTWIRSDLAVAVGRWLTADDVWFVSFTHRDIGTLPRYESAEAAMAAADDFLERRKAAA